MAASVSASATSTSAAQVVTLEDIEEALKDPARFRIVINPKDYKKVHYIRAEMKTKTGAWSGLNIMQIVDTIYNPVNSGAKFDSACLTYHVDDQLLRVIEKIRAIIAQLVEQKRAQLRPIVEAAKAKKGAKMPADAWLVSTHDIQVVSIVTKDRNDQELPPEKRYVRAKIPLNRAANAASRTRFNMTQAANGDAPAKRDMWPLSSLNDLITPNSHAKIVVNIANLICHEHDLMLSFEVMAATIKTAPKTSGEDVAEAFEAVVAGDDF